MSVALSFDVEGTFTWATTFTISHSNGTCLGSSLNEGEDSVCLTSLYYLFYMTFFSNENIVYMLKNKLPK